MLFHRIPILKIFSEKKFRVYLFDNPRVTHSELIRLCIADWLEGKLNCHMPAHVHWSKSDSDDYVAIAVGSKQIGVDIEVGRPREFEKLCRRYFSEEEQVKSAEEFYGIWVRKEAYWKKVKKGINGNLSVVIPEHSSIITLEGLPNNLYGAVAL
jgi:phosphopantetheinyl transferase